MGIEIHASLRAEDIVRLGSIAITNSMVMAWAAMVVLIVFGYFAGRNPQLIPRGAQNVMETILEGLLGLVENTAGHYARRVFPLIATLFLFIITANYMGLLPGLGTVTVANPNVHHDAEALGRAFVPVAAAAGLAEVVVQPAASSPAKADPQPGAKAGAAGTKEKHEPDRVPLLRAANADINMTLGMGLIAFFFIHISGIVVHSLSGYWKELSTPLLLTPVKIVIEAFLPVSLSMRLFGNIFGGEMLLTVMAFPFVAIPFMAMELLFGFIQALIFTMLTLIFTSLAVYVPPGHSEAHHSGGSQDTGLGAHPATGEAAEIRHGERLGQAVAGAAGHA